jgi:hypothetical protein
VVGQRRSGLRWHLTKQHRLAALASHIMPRRLEVLRKARGLHDVSRRLVRNLSVAQLWTAPWVRSGITAYLSDLYMIRNEIGLFGAAHAGRIHGLLSVHLHRAVRIPLGYRSVGCAVPYMRRL